MPPGHDPKFAEAGKRTGFQFDISARYFRKKVMTRLAFAFAASALLVTACAPKEAEPSAVEPTTTAAEPVPSPALPVEPAPETRVAAMNLMCGGESFRVAFEDTRAVVVNADGSNTELAKLPADANSAPGVDSFTNGMMTFTKQGGRDTPTVIKYAKGRMAFQDCAIAQN
jgi:hypothetical protein